MSPRVRAVACGGFTLALVGFVPVTARSQGRGDRVEVVPDGKYMLALAAERRGDMAGAAKAFGEILQERPADVGSLTGLERVLPKLDRRIEMVPAISKALRADSNNTNVLAVAIRTFAVTGHADSARKWAERWTKRVPGDESPYREWSMAALEIQDRVQARAALDLGRAQLGVPAMALELAQLLQSQGDIAGAAREWLALLRVTPTFRQGAVGVLVQVPQAQRSVLRQALSKDGSREAKQVLGLLLVKWGEPVEGSAMLRSALPTDTEQAVTLLRAMLDDLRNREDRPALLARAAALEAMATRQTGTLAVRSRMDGARAYADAGDERNARRLLSEVAADPAAPQGMASSASTALLGVLLAEKKSAEAERVLNELAPTLPADERDQQARRVALAWARAGDFERADKLVATDSSTAGFDLRGRLKLFRGDLAGASELLKVAGPFDDEREDALERVTILTLLQAVDQDSLPALGAAMLLLEQGDSARTVVALEAIAGTLKPMGAAESRFLAGRIALARQDTVVATRLFKAADVPEAPGSAPAARMFLARLSAATGHVDESLALLERLILEYPESAVVPEARRYRDQLRGAIPGGGK